jgi:hypothetical protein
MEAASRLIRVEDLLFDPNNPRLPKGKEGLNQTQLVEFYYHNAAVQELVDSMLENGFFPHEPLIASEADADGKFTVWEGNRRLAALKIINQEECASGLPDPNIGLEITPDLSSVPVVIVQDYEEVRRFIGFRHISGLKTWPAEAKARFVLEEVEKAITEGHDQPFKYVGKAIGSNSVGVRSYYLAAKTLEIAEDSGANTAEIRTNRFAVWQRLWNSSGFREYVNLANSESFEELNSSIRNTIGSRLKEAVGDLSTAPNGNSLIKDSRDLDRYGKVLSNALAREVLRETNDLAVASQLIESDVLSEKFDRVLNHLRALKKEVEIASPKDLEAVQIVRGAKLIRSEAISVHSLVEASKED